MVVAPHFGCLLLLGDTHVEKSFHRFFDPCPLSFMVPDDMVWSPVCRLCLPRDVGGVPLTPADGRESNSRPF